MTCILLDNYDSFTWNIYQYLCEEGAQVRVYRNDKVTLAELEALNPSHLVISPGPGHPSTDAGISKKAIECFAGKIPILGVCLGHQCIYEIYGGTVSNAGEIVHGKASELQHDGQGVYLNLPKQGVRVTRYHSLSGSPPSLPESLLVTSKTENGIVMGVRHRELCIEGVQFHPESILSGEHGRLMLRNFLKMNKGKWSELPEFQVESPPSNPTNSESILQKIHKKRIQDVQQTSQLPGRSLDNLTFLLPFAPPVICLKKRLLQGLTSLANSSDRSVAVMAEIKRASPSKGPLNLNANTGAFARTYALGGASVISVLTEPEWFLGRVEDLRLARDAVQGFVNRPAILRKDFIFDSYQIVEARVAGADSVLLIVALLEDEALLQRLILFSRSIGMEPLVEVNNEKEMHLAISVGAKVIGVNHRNLHTFEMDMENATKLASIVPEDVILCALSGIEQRSDVEKLLEKSNNKLKAILVGEALMKADNPKQLIHSLSQSQGTNPENNVKPCKNPVKVKICGVSSVEIALEAVEAGADFLGLVFVDTSKRLVTLEQARAITQAIKAKFTSPTDNNAENTNDWDSRWTKFAEKKVQIVGVFQNQSVEEINNIAQLADLDFIQLHGDEPIETSNFLCRPVIKAFHVSPQLTTLPGDMIVDITREGYHALALVDSRLDRTAGGGQGVAFPWSILQPLAEKPLILAGGLNLDNVAEAIKMVRPWGVDVSSGVETGGNKDGELIREFIRIAKSA